MSFGYTSLKQKSVLNNTPISKFSVDIRLPLGPSTSKTTADPTNAIDTVVADDKSVKMPEQPEDPEILAAAAILMSMHRGK